MHACACIVYIYICILNKGKRERERCVRAVRTFSPRSQTCLWVWVWSEFGNMNCFWPGASGVNLRGFFIIEERNQWSSRKPTTVHMKNNWDSTSDHWEKWVYLSEHLPETMVWSSNREAFWERSNCSRGWHDISPEPLSHRTQYFLKQFLQHSFPSYPIFNPFSINSLSFYSYHFIHYIFILYIYISLFSCLFNLLMFIEIDGCLKMVVPQMDPNGHFSIETQH